MSTSAAFVDPTAFTRALEAVRSDASDTKWLVIGHPEGVPDQLELQGSGSDVDELREVLDDGKTQYALVRMEETIDLSVTIKFAYINWMGPDVGFAVRGRYGVLEGSIRSYLDPTHTSIRATKLEETTPEYIAEQIGQQSGQISKVRDDVDSRLGAASNTPQRPKGEAPKVSLQGVGVDVADNIQDVLLELRNSESEVNCVGLHYPENNVKKGLEVLHIGNHGIGSLSEFFNEDSVVFALVRVVDIVDEIPTVKFAQIKWVGDRVKPMTKAKIATQSGEINRILGSTHVAIVASHRNEVTERAVMDRIMAASGSRKVVG